MTIQVKCLYALGSFLSARTLNMNFPKSCSCLILLTLNNCVY